MHGVLGDFLSLACLDGESPRVIKVDVVGDSELQLAWQGQGQQQQHQPSLAGVQQVLSLTRAGLLPFLEDGRVSSMATLLYELFFVHALVNASGWEEL